MEKMSSTRDHSKVILIARQGVEEGLVVLLFCINDYDSIS
jgi:hypothetical protein